MRSAMLLCQRRLQKRGPVRLWRRLGGIRLGLWRAKDSTNVPNDGRGEGRRADALAGIRRGTLRARKDATALVLLRGNSSRVISCSVRTSAPCSDSLARRLARAPLCGLSGLGRAEAWYKEFESFTPLGALLAGAAGAVAVPVMKPRSSRVGTLRKFGRRSRQPLRRRLGVSTRSVDCGGEPFAFLRR